MTLKQLLKKIDNSYPEGLAKASKGGDTLATFIVSELTETFEPKETNMHKLSRARRVMSTVVQDAAGVMSALVKLHFEAIHAEIGKEKKSAPGKK
jgi:Holliday junction resolvasome RuvABC DNA-binding subunit